MHKKELCRCQQTGIKNRRIGYIERPHNGMLKFDIDCPLHGVVVIKRDGIFDASILTERLETIETISPEDIDENWVDSFIDGLEDFYDYVTNSIPASPDDPLRAALDDVYATDVPEKSSDYLSGWHCARDMCAERLHKMLEKTDKK